MSKVPEEFVGVTAVAKANIYFDGNVVSHTVLTSDNAKKTLAATEALIAGELGPLRPKPFGAWRRNLQLRWELGYWGRGG